MSREPELPEDDEEVRLVRNDKGDDELSAWDPESGETERTFNEGSVRGALAGVARWAWDNLDLMPDYGRLFFNPGSATAWWVGGDGDGDGASREIERRLGGVPGVLEARYESEGFPPRDDQDWEEIDRDKSTTLESFVGTGAIAFAPSVAPIGKVRKAHKRRKHQTESPMADRRRRLAEESGSWFKEGPVRGDHQMDSPTGEGVAKKTATRETMNSSHDTKFKQSGDEWPRKHKGGIAMGTPDDHGQGGDHESTHGDPDDGYQTETGHDWPDDPKNSGQGVAEPFDRTLEGTEMPKGAPPKGFGAGAPASDSRDGSSANESWSLDRITAMMETDSFGGRELQQLFDAYAQETEYVCLENFAELCRAHGAQNLLDESVLLSLMSANREFVFHEMKDASGPYWVPREPLSEGEVPDSFKAHQFGKGGKKKDDEGSDDEEGADDEEGSDEDEGKKPWESRDRRGGSISEAKLPAAFKAQQGKAKKGGKSDKKKDARGASPQSKGKPGGKRQKPAFLKSESADPNARCRDWLATAAEIRNLVSEGHVTAGSAQRALQASFNVQLSRQHLMGCSRSVLESVRRVVDHYGLGVDRQFQLAKRLWEARYDMGPEAGGAPDPFGDPAGDPGLGPMDDMDGGDQGMMNDLDAHQDLAGPGDGFDEFGGDPSGMGDEVGVGDLPEVGGMGEGGVDDPYGDDPYDDDPGFDPSPKGEQFGDMPAGMRGIQGAQMRGRGGPGGRMAGPGPGAPPAAGGWVEGRGRGRSPLNEDESWFREGAPRTVGGHRMDQGGSPVGGELGGGAGGDYPEEDADFTEESEKDLLGHDQDNTGEGQVEFEHGGEGTMRDGHGPKGSAPEPKAGIKENMRRISGHVKRRLQECSRRVPAGKYALQFSAVVAGNDRKVHRAYARDNLAEAVADAEELLLIYGRQRVMLEAAFLRGGVREVYRERIALPAVAPRGPFVTEGRACFRFPKHAEQFASELLREGKDCRVIPHNWGTAVEAKVSGKLARAAFAAMTK